MAAPPPSFSRRLSCFLLALFCTAVVLCHYWCACETSPGPVGHRRRGTRAVTVAPRFASRVHALNLNVVTERVDLEEGRKFDLVVATNILVYYDRFQQALGMASIASMMSPGGIFLCNDVLSARHVKSLEFLDRHAVAYATSGPYGDNVLAYRHGLGE